MTLREQVAIFKNIYDSEAEVWQKKAAIRSVLEMETHNSIAKQELINALKWLMEIEQCRL